MTNLSIAHFEPEPDITDLLPLMRGYHPSSFVSALPYHEMYVRPRTLYSLLIEKGQEETLLPSDKHLTNLKEKLSARFKLSDEQLYCLMIFAASIEIQINIRDSINALLPRLRETIAQMKMLRSFAESPDKLKRISLQYNQLTTDEEFTKTTINAYPVLNLIANSFLEISESSPLKGFIKENKHLIDTEHSNKKNTELQISNTLKNLINEVSNWKVLVHQSHKDLMVGYAAYLGKRFTFNAGKDKSNSWSSEDLYEQFWENDPKINQSTTAKPLLYDFENRLRDSAKKLRVKIM